jgi:hypothetical protein
MGGLCTLARIRLAKHRQLKGELHPVAPERA